MLSLHLDSKRAEFCKASFQTFQTGRASKHNEQKCFEVMFSEDPDPANATITILYSPNAHSRQL